MEDFHRLEVYGLARAFSKDVHFATRRFPAHLRKLAAQLDDATESIGSNIAEGCGRKNWKHSNAELIRYLHYSFSSACEAQHRLAGAHDKELLTTETYLALEEQVQTIKRKLTRFIQKLERDDRGRLH